MKRQILLRAKEVASLLNYDLTLSSGARGDLRDELCLLQHRLGARGVDQAMADSSDEGECE